MSAHRRRRRGRRWPWLAGTAVVLAGAGFLTFRAAPWRERGVEAPPPAPAPRAPLAPPTVPPPPPPDDSLPPLAESDPVLEEEARDLSVSPTFDTWLRNGSLVRRFVTAVENVADGESPRAQVAFLDPGRAFQAREEGGRTVVAPASYARWDGLADVVASLDATSCARLYRRLSTLLEAAYRELGRTDRTFDTALSLAIARLLATPVPDDAMALTSLVTIYELADPRLETLSRAEKHLLRMGPRNVRLVQAKLRELEAALAASAAAPAR